MSTTCFAALDPVDATCHLQRHLDTEQTIESLRRMTQLKGLASSVWYNDALGAVNGVRDFIPGRSP
jgi:hypothetical protein